MFVFSIFLLDRTFFIYTFYPVQLYIRSFCVII